MKNPAVTLCFSILAVAFFSCGTLIREEDLFPVPVMKNNDPPGWAHFNQVYTSFGESEINCLLEHWHTGTYREEGPMAFRVINDDSTYHSFFSCKPEVKLPEINFSAKSLLVGIKAGGGNTPVNIKRIEQKMERDENGDLILYATVTGENRGSGGEWFGFTSLIPRTQRQVTLEMKYIFE